jgi:NAD-dependent SIR2 family protein deacetylase
MTMHRTDINDERYIKMRSKLEKSRCYECSETIYESDPIVWDTKERKAYCEECGKEFV